MQTSRNGFLWALTIILTVTACESETVKEEGSKVDLSTDIQRGSYLIGYDQAQGLVQQTYGVVDLQAFAAGVNDYVNSNEAQVGEAQVGEAQVGEAQVGEKERVKAFAAIREAVAAKEQATVSAADGEAKAFRQAFAAQAGVVTLDSGLMYQVITEGTGPQPTAQDTVVTHYHGTLTNGEVFDSSVDRGSPASFSVGGVIKGWTEALQLMGVGAKWKLVIPPDLAYGERGAGGAIGPNATLVFEVELLEIK